MLLSRFVVGKARVNSMVLLSHSVVGKACVKGMVLLSRFIEFALLKKEIGDRRNKNGKISTDSFQTKES
jgi:hypothetical protein